MRCHFVYDEGVKILIPGCYGSLHKNDLSCCNCTHTYDSFEKDKYKKVVAELKNENSEMAKHINYLTRIIDKLTNKEK